MFNSTSAILALKGLLSDRHKGIKNLFDMHFVKTNLIDKKYSKLFNVVQEIREDCDYESFYVVDKGEVDSNFIMVKEFIEHMEDFINKVVNGGISWELL